MRRLSILFSGLLIAFSAFAEHENHQVQKGDSLIEILKAREYGSNYRELLPFIEETLRLNPGAFRNNNADDIIPGRQILLPDDPTKAILEPVIEVVIEPEPEPEPEPEIIGRVDIISGQIVILRDGKNIESRNQQMLIAEDTVVTNENAIAEIQLTDNTMFTLGPNSKLSIEQYQYREQQNQSNNPIGSMIAFIHRGFLRTITGLIGKSGDNQYQVKSLLTATVGVRGTDFTIRSCIEKQLCGELLGVSVAVQEGGIGFKNQAGEINLNKNQFTRIETANESPVLKPLPEGFFDISKEMNEIKLDKPWWQTAIDWVSGLF